MSRLSEIKNRHAGWQKRIEQDLKPHYDQSDWIERLWIESVICVILAKTGGV
jgi:hypothetical protein